MSNSDVSPDNTPKIAPDQEGRVAQDVTRTTLHVLFIGILISAVAWIIRPFVTSMIWAGMIVVTTWPLLLVLQARLKNKRWVAVAIMTTALLLVVVVPIMLAIVAIIKGADDAYAWVKSLSTFTVPAPPEWVVSVPLVGPKLADRWKQLTVTSLDEVYTYFAPYARQTLSWFVSQAGSVGMVVLQFFLTVIIAAILYAKGETASAGIASFARRLGGERGEAVMLLAEKAIRGVALGVVVTAIIQATVGGIGLVIAKVPAAALLTAVTFMLCLAQMGPALVLVPVLIWVYWKDGILWGSILLVFVVLAMTLDNFLRPVLIRKGADLPLIMIFAGVIGGLIAFGIVGLFIGPVVLAVAHTLLKAWISGDAEK
ncbi:MAG: putative inner membrane protein [Syntrophorhabdus sp. PtaU1.Bin153]|nr:MAG: putative inner membrane protein [Syntrophorhabdus sp. PtaU1.Bin153]